jgi:hypothetical protein
MNLPSHSYVFMKKNEFVEVMLPEKLGYTKNDSSGVSTTSDIDKSKVINSSFNKLTLTLVSNSVEVLDALNI